MTGKASTRPAPRSGSRTARVVDALASSALFGGLARSDLQRLAPAFEATRIEGGRTVFAEGEPGDAVFVVVAGRLRAHRGAGDEEVVLGEIGPGEVVGETAMIAAGPRTATVRTVRDTELLRLSADAFHRTVRSFPDVLLAVAGTIAARAVSDGPATAPVRTVAVVPAGRGAIPDVAEVARGLASALKRFGRVKRLSRTSVSRAIGAADGALAESRAISWLHSVEEDHRFVIYQADDDPSVWTERCLRQADVVLLCGWGTADPQPGPVEEGLDELATTARRELVLLWPTDGPERTERWLAARGVAAHHHVIGDGDYARLARRVAGRAVGLVLGGGGARGFAHLGVMRALEEAGIPVDMVGGTSIGAIMGAGLASGWDHAVRHPKAVDAFVKPRILVGPTLPMLALSSSRKVTRLLRDPAMLGERRIEDLPIPYFCVSANITTDEMVVHTSGPLWQAVRASASLPGILPPVAMDGHLLVDGGVVNDVPVRPMRDRLQGTVIAVDINPAADLGSYEAFEPTISGWRILGRKLNPFRSSMAIPNAVEVMMRAKEIWGRRAQSEDLAAAPPDLLLRPPTGQVGALDFRGAQRLIDEAYEWTARELAAWDRTAAIRAR